MTEPRTPAPAPHPSGTIAAGLVLFLVVLVFLAWQLRGGNDPKLGGGPAARAAAARPHVIVRRRVIHTKVVVTPAAGPAPGATAVTTAPVTSSVATPAAAAPAPAPAPVTTRAS